MQIVVLQMPYNDPDTQLYPNAVWAVVQDSRDLLGLVAGLDVGVWPDADHLARQTQDLTRRHTNVTRTVLMTEASKPPSGASRFEDSGHLYVDILMSVADVDTGQKDADGKAIMAPYYASGVPTLITVPDTWGLNG